MPNLNPEEKARENIDHQLVAAGWVVQDISEVNLAAARGIAVREVRSKGGPADYILFVDGKALGVVEAKKEGTTLSGVAEQSARYSHARNWIPQRWADPLPFTYESTGIETNFRDQRDPDSRSRPVFAFHSPEHLLELVQQPDTLRALLKALPAAHPLAGPEGQPDQTSRLRDCQISAITGLEKSFAENRPRALLQMATGSGKTYTAVTQAYRLIKHAGAKCILFLVDRGNLGRQTVREFQNYTTPDDGRSFTDLYNVQMLGPGGIDPVCKVTVSTIQRLYAQLSDNDQFDDEADEHSGYETGGTTKKTGLVKISAVTWGKFDELESKTITRDDQIRVEHVIHYGDFLLSRANTLELVGAPVVVEQITRHLMLSDKVLRFRFLERLEKFALFWLRSKLGRKEIESRATGNQLSMRNIAQASLRAIPIPLPPLAEQHQIVAEIEARTTAIDHLEAELDRQITRSNRLRQSTLQSAFLGKL